MCENFTRALARVVVAQVCQGLGLKSVQRGACETLGDIFLRYISEVGRAASSYAEHAGRTESTLGDVLLAFQDLGTSITEIERFVENTDEVPFAHPLPRFPIPRAPLLPHTFVERGEEPPSHVLPFLPAFPDAHTYVHTPLAPATARLDARRERLARVHRQRQAEKSLVSLDQRCAGAAQPLAAPNTDGAAATAVAPASSMLAGDRGGTVAKIEDGGVRDRGGAMMVLPAASAPHPARDTARSSDTFWGDMPDGIGAGSLTRKAASLQPQAADGVDAPSPSPLPALEPGQLPRVVRLREGSGGGDDRERRGGKERAGSSWVAQALACPVLPAFSDRLPLSFSVKYPQQLRQAALACRGASSNALKRPPEIAETNVELERERQKKRAAVEDILAGCPASGAGTGTGAGAGAASTEKQETKFLVGTEDAHAL